MNADDLRQVLALLADYGRTLDDGRWEQHMALYAEDCRLRVFGREYAGREAIEAFMRQAHRGHHLTGVPSVELDGETARSRADYVFFRDDMQLYSAGSYEDELVREHGSWRFAVRDIHIRLRAEG